MKRLRDDVHDTPPFKLSYFSSHGQLYGSLIDVVDALSYVREVRDTFPNQMEKYEMFIDIMKDLKARRTKSLNIYQRIDIVGVIAKVKELFKGHPSLILGFNAFVPNGYEKIIQDEDQAPPKKTTYKEQTLKIMERFREDVYDTTPFKQPFCSSHEKFRTNIVDPLSYVREVRGTFPNQMEKYEMFIDIIKDFKAQRIDTIGVVTKVKELFKGHPSLILGFYAFVPNGYGKIINDEDQAPSKKITYKEQALKSMELLREDVNDTPPFQRPFFSSHIGELLTMAKIEGPDYPYERFLDAVSHKRYKEIQQMGFCLERSFNMKGVAEKAPVFYNRIKEFCWGPLVVSPPFSQRGWVLEFYAHLPMVLWNSPNPTICIRGVDVPVDAQSVNLALGVPEVPHEPYMAKLREMDMIWLRNTLVEEKYWDEVSWFTKKGLTSHYYSLDARRCLTLVGQRICPSRNLTDVTYSRAMVVACIIAGIPVNVGKQIVSEWKDFYCGIKKSPFLPGLVSVLCRQAGVPLDDTYYEVENDGAFNPLLMRKKPSRAPKKRKMDEARSRQAAAGPDEDEDADADPATTQSQPPLSSSSLEADVGAVKRFVETTSASPNTTFSFPGHSHAPSGA